MSTGDNDQIRHFGKTPKFSGSLKIYYSQLDDYFQAAKITEDLDKITIFKLGLPALNYKIYCIDRVLPDSYNALKNDLLSTFEPEEPDNVIKDRFLSAVQLPDESIRTYFERVKSYALRAYDKMDSRARDEILKDQLIRGLRSLRLREQALLNDNMILKDLILHLAKFETITGGYHQEHSINSVQEQKIDKLTETVNTLAETVANLAKTMNEQMTSKFQTRYRQIVCWNCGISGHRSFNCRSGAAECENCGKSHLTKFCNLQGNGDSRAYSNQPGRDRQKGEPQTPVSIHSNFCDVIGRGRRTYACIFVDIGGKLRSSMVDTGASLSLISESLWKNLGCPPLLTDKNPSLSVANKTKLDVKGLLNLEVKLGSLVVNYGFFVASDLNADCIIGVDFLDDNECKVDFVKKLLIVRGESLSLFTQPSDTISVITAVDDYVLPSFSETIIEVHHSNTLRNSDSLLITPQSDFNLKLNSKIMIASCLVEPSPIHIMKIMNITDNPVNIKKGTVVGKIETVQKCTNDGNHEMSNISVEEEIDYGSYFPLDTLSNKEKSVVLELFKEYRDVFAFSKNEVGHTNVLEHCIDTINPKPIKLPNRRMPHVYQEEIDTQVEWLLSQGIVTPSSSPWAAPIVMVRKKDGSMRMCVDYRRLNGVTIKDSFPLPHITDILDSLSGCSIFSTIDLCSGYLQVPVREQDRSKTAFVTNRGLYEYTRLPFGVCNGPATFQRLMSIVLRGLVGEKCLVYLDDIIIFSKSFDDHLNDLRSIFDRLRQSGLTLKPTKCNFYQEKIDFLGHVVSADGVHVDSSKIDNVKNWPTPQSKSELKAFLGLAGYYRRFIQNFSGIASPLNKLIGKSLFRWSEEAQQAFQTLKDKLTEAPILAFPDVSNDSAKFILDTDASDFAIGAVLSQMIDGKERVIAYGSRSLSKPERNYCTTRKELLSIVHFSKHFRPYLLGKDFIVRTDHSSLQWLHNLKDVDGQLARWLLSLQEFSFQSIHRPGKKHCNADALSRYPPHQGKDTCPTCSPRLICTTVISSDNETFDNRLLSHQDDDEDVKILKKACFNNEPISTTQDSELSLFGKALAKQLNCLVIKNEVLGYNDKGIWKPVLPPSMVREILEEIHSGPGGGHFGINKMKEKIRKRFWWPDYQKDVRAYVLGCDVCAKSKDPIPKPNAFLQPIKTGRPNQIIGIDIVGPLPLSSYGNRYLLVMIDFFTKWAEVVPIANQTSCIIIPKIIEHWISRHGVMERIHTDQGRNFESDEFKDFCIRYQIRKSHSSPYHPEGNGQTERLNRTLNMLLKTHVENETDWDQTLPLCMMAYRSSIQESTRFSPFELLYGRDMRLPCDNYIDLPVQGNRTSTSYLNLRDKLTQSYKLATQQQNMSKFRQANQHNKHANQKVFVVGDAVWLHSCRIKGYAKFHRPWTGPYVVIEVLGASTYRLRRHGLSRGKTLVVHHDRLKPCFDVKRVTNLNKLDVVEKSKKNDVGLSDDTDDDFNDTLDGGNDNSCLPMSRMNSFECSRNVPYQHSLLCRLNSSRSFEESSTSSTEAMVEMSTSSAENLIEFSSSTSSTENLIEFLSSTSSTEEMVEFSSPTSSTEKMGVSTSSNIEDSTSSTVEMIDPENQD